MAIVKFNAAIKEIHGKSGGANYARTQYGIEFKETPPSEGPHFRTEHRMTELSHHPVR